MLNFLACFHSPNVSSSLVTAMKPNLNCTKLFSCDHHVVFHSTNKKLSNSCHILQTNFPNVNLLKKLKVAHIDNKLHAYMDPKCPLLITTAQQLSLPRAR